MGIFSALGFTANDDEKRARRMVQSSIGEEKGRRRGFDRDARETRGRYLDLLEGYDPREYMEEAAGAVGEDLFEDFGERQAASNQSLNARGFYGAGINRGRLQRGFSDRLSRALSSLSLSAAGLEQDRIGMVGRQGESDAYRADRSRGNELDLIHGNRDAEQQARNSRLRGTLGLLKAGSRFLPESWMGG